MSVSYRAVQWNRQKRIYDLVLAAAIFVFIAAFAGFHRLLHPHATAETVMIRALATLALVLLHVVLAIGPLARLDRRFVPLLYNRRHLGVTTFLVAAGHGLLALLQFHSLGNVNPLVSLFASNTNYDSLAAFPFQTLGFAALVVLFLMAATSHDFWLKNLGPRVWKSLHMLVYAAYALVVLHVALGTLQSETSPVFFGVMLALAAGLASLHLVAGWREVRRDRPRALRSLAEPSPAGPSPAAGGFVEVCDAFDIPENRAKIVALGGERIAVFRYGGNISAISNVCRHQNGPLGEGAIIDGCVTCPWHGYQYLPAEGRAPAPFTERIETYDVRVEGTTVFVNPKAYPPGTARPPARIGADATASGERGPAAARSRDRRQRDGEHEEFYVGYLPRSPRATARLVRTVIVLLFAVAIAVPAGFALFERPFSTAAFEFGEPRELVGRIVESPVPMLRIRVGEDPGGNPVHRMLPLVAPGKFGPGSLIESLRGRADGPLYDHVVRVRGSLVLHDGKGLLELSDGEASFLSIQRDPPDAGEDAPAESDLGPLTVRGEIVDSKCYFGVMKPGLGKPHRSCAVRCISGGIPPVLMSRNEAGEAEYLLLTATDGRPIGPRVLDRVADPVEVTGTLVQYDDWWLLRIDPSDVRRL